MMQSVKSSDGLFKRIQESARIIRQEIKIVPEVAIILGTGLGKLTKQIKQQTGIDYEKIPNFAVSTVESHTGRMIAGNLSGKKVVAMEGRFHCYEGYSAEEVTFPVRVLKELGAKTLVVSNVAGGLNLDYQKGEIVLIDDHINMTGVNPLMGLNDNRLGPRFPDMSAPYSPRLMKLTEEAAKEQKISVKRGVYLGIAGPNLETRAEYRMMRTMGADLVGMSTIPEVLVGVHMGMKILGISIVTDICDPDHLEAIDIKEIIRIANEAGPKLGRLVEAAVKKF